MTQTHIYSDESVRACSNIIRKYFTNMHHERTTSAALLSAMLEQDLLPALRVALESSMPKVEALKERYTQHALNKQLARGRLVGSPPLEPECVGRVVELMRKQHRNLLRRREGVLTEVDRAVEASRTAGVPAVRPVGYGASGNRLLPEYVVESAMNHHRRAFEDSEAQTKFRSTDQDFGHPAWQWKRSQGSRFRAMLTDQYGGPKAIQAFLRTGKLEGIRLPPMGAPAEGQRRAVPQPREGRTGKSCARIRDMRA